MRITTDFRDISDPTCTRTSELIHSKLDSFESRSMHGQLPISWAKAKDFSVWDVNGNKHIDFTSTIFVANVGHSNEAVLKAIRRQLDSDLISTYSYPTEIRAKYLETLVDFVGNGLEKAFLLSAGTEAMDAVYKLIKMAGQNQGKRRSGVVAFSGNWHGRTLGAQMLSNNLVQKEWIGFQDPDIHYLRFPLPWEVPEGDGENFFHSEIQTLEGRGIDIGKDIAGFVLETFQGWGALFYPKTFVEALSKFAQQRNILVAFDEMQAGFSRTGKNFGFEHYEVSPDLVACGKGMGGGFPVSGVVGKGWIMDLPSVGNMSSTHSANPLACAAGLSVIDEIETKHLTERSRKLGELLHRRLNAVRDQYSEYIHSVQGRGLIASVIFSGERQAAARLASRVCDLALANGVILVHTGRESIKIGPPLVIEEAALAEGLDVFERSIREALG